VSLKVRVQILLQVCGTPIFKRKRCYQEDGNADEIVVKHGWILAYTSGQRGDTIKIGELSQFDALPHRKYERRT
jgi:hypothetical protein